jgi:dephospho-CoA kinase
MILGFTGGYASGKDTVAKYFLDRGFKYISLSDFIREEMRERNIEITRDNLIKTANDLRAKYGEWILAKMARERIESDKNYVVVSIRNPGEVRELRKIHGFKLINVTAPIALRYERAKARNREKEHIGTLEEFRKSEERELKGKKKTDIQLLEVYAMADIVLNNKYKNVEDLYAVVRKMHHDLAKKKPHFYKKIRKKLYALLDV